MTTAADTRRPGEALFDRAIRTYRTYEVFRTAADNAWQEAEAAHERAREAEARAELAADDYQRARAALIAAGQHDDQEKETAP